MRPQSRYLIVDGHSVIFASAQLREHHLRRPARARDMLVKWLRNYQDWTGIRVIVVFDGSGPQSQESSEPHDIQIFFSRGGQTADSLIERLVAKYARRCSLTVATSDYLERQTVAAFGAESISAEALLELVRDVASRPMR